jgi:hypothetical protein
VKYLEAFLRPEVSPVSPAPGGGGSEVFRVPLDLSARRGPGQEDDTLAREIWCDWRWAVANWPHDRWLAWRRRAGELLPERPSAEEVREADRRAYLELAGGVGRVTI